MIADRVVDPILELPFDQYQRYRVAADLVAALGVPAGSRVLEVGGAPGPLEQFLSGFELVVSDVVGSHGGRFLLANGAALPFPDGSFAVVVTLDTLEHVPAGHRAAFLAELRRVSADLVVLSAPFASPQLELAEEALNEFIRARFGGNFATLDEHAQNGLPELEETSGALTRDGWAAATLPSGYLPHWLAAMLVHHELLATGLASLGKLHAYYNAVVSPLDCREPSYRHVIVAGRDRDATELEHAVDSLRSPGDSAAGSAALGAIASSVLAQRVHTAVQSSELGHELEGARMTIAGLERELADRDAHVFELERRLADQQRELEAVRVDAARRWMLGIPYAAHRVRRRFANPQESKQA